MAKPWHKDPERRRARFEKAEKEKLTPLSSNIATADEIRDELVKAHAALDALARLNHNMQIAVFAPFLGHIMKTGCSEEKLYANMLLNTLLTKHKQARVRLEVLVAA